MPLDGVGVLKFVDDSGAVASAHFGEKGGKGEGFGHFFENVIRSKNVFFFESSADSLVAGAADADEGAKGGAGFFKDGKEGAA